MRNWIDLLNESVIEDQNVLSDAYVIISQYVTHGEWRSPTQFNRDFDALMATLPRPAAGGWLYRVIRLSDEQAEQYCAGTLVLHNRRYSSWTKSHSSAIRIAMTKGSNTLIVKHFFQPEHIVIDVPEFYEDHDYTSYDGFEEYHKYVKVENEVIVFDSGEMRIDGSNSTMWKAPDIDPPMIGDRCFYHEEDDEGMEIDDVDHEQPYADRGLYCVTLSDGDEAVVRCTGTKEWEIVDLDIQEGHVK